MASYRVFEFSYALPKKSAAGEDVRFVRDGFSYGALIFPAIWLLWNRLWMIFAGFLGFAAIFVLAADSINPILAVFLNALVGLYLGFEGTNLKAMKLRNTGWHETDIVIGGDEEEAELRYFSKQRKNEGSKQAPVSEEMKPPIMSRARSRPAAKRQVIGSFPLRPSGSRS